MIKVTEIETATYQINDDMYVDIVINRVDGNYEAYTYKADEGVKELLFGMPMAQQSYEEFLAIVEANI